VVLAAGDYANNAKIIAQYKGNQFQNIDGINPFATGDGHELARQAGAVLVNMDITYGPELRFVPSAKKPFQQWLPVSGIWSRIMAAVARHLPTYAIRLLIKRLLVTWQHPENSLFDDGAILINREGLRFVDEKIWPDREIGVANQPDKIAYILLDRNLIKRYSQWPHFISTAPDIAYAYVRDYQRLRSDVTIRGETISDLSNLANIDEIALKRTVQRAFPESQGPWLLLGPLKAYFTTTEGGTNINQEFQVLNEQGAVISGLYAVGQNGLGGMILWGHGLHIAWAMTSGRLAGKILMGRK
jgi:fumarate reductase flavoprotein subunit